ncbi:hypothetical protein DUNSADRAFT_14960 [Dunaliella salina]|uniref:Uncharacterized protein n=1 Tax=Dunaliella salina TaxID=3046 RepID=A0ABQ7G6C3_DUNSA|nr:hypothetical protein DUNSADRAFT_14960 [Dunaliella salina]|eukprot:KAF5830142.1 hypothetical protein DUNSADRAFT_14960 [Dunaliella salina]
MPPLYQRPPSAPADCTAPLDASVSSIRNPKRQEISIEGGPECKGSQYHSKSGSDNKRRYVDAGGGQSNGARDDHGSTTGGNRIGNVERAASGHASSSTHDSSTYGGSTSQDDEREEEEKGEEELEEEAGVGEDIEEAGRGRGRARVRMRKRTKGGQGWEEEEAGEGDDEDEGYVTADEEELAQPPMQAAILAWELECALKAGNHAKADSLRERAAAAAAAAEEMVAAVAAAEAAREAQIAAAKAERARAKSAHAIAMARQGLESSGRRPEEESRQLSVEAKGLGRCVGQVHEVPRKRGTAGKGELVKGRARQKSAASQSHASGDGSGVSSTETSPYDPVGLEVEGCNLARDRNSGPGGSVASGTPVHIRISKPLSNRQEQPLEAFGAVRVPPSKVPDFPEPLTPPPSPSMSFARASGKSTGSRAATMEELKRVSSRPSQPDTPDHLVGNLEGIQGQQLKASANKVQHILEQRRQDEQALVKRLYPTGWQNVGDMCILEKDDDEVVVPQEGAPIFSEDVYPPHPLQGDPSNINSLDAVNSVNHLTWGPRPKWQGPQIDERFNVHGTGLGAGTRAEDGAGSEGVGDQGSRAGGAGDSEGDQESNEGSGGIEGGGKGHAGSTLRGGRPETETAGLHQFPPGAGRSGGGLAEDSAMGSGQMAKLQARQAAVAKVVARHTAHHARYGALAAAYSTYRPVPAHLTRFPPQFKLDEEQDSVLGSSGAGTAASMALGSSDPATGSDPVGAKAVTSLAHSSRREHAGVSSGGTETAHPHGLPGSPHEHIHSLHGSLHQGTSADELGLQGSLQGDQHQHPGGSAVGLQGSLQGGPHQHTGNGEHEGAGAGHPGAGLHAGAVGQELLMHMHHQHGVQQQQQHPHHQHGAQQQHPHHQNAVQQQHTHHQHGVQHQQQQQQQQEQNSGAGVQGRGHITIPGDLLTNAQVSNVYGVPPSDEDVQFEVLYGLTRLNQAPPSSPKSGARQGQLIELQIQGQEEHPSPDHVSSPRRAKSAEYAAWSSDSAFTAALVNAAHQLKGVGQKATRRRGVRVRVLDPGLPERVGWMDGLQGSEGSGGYEEGKVGRGVQQQGVQAVNVGEGEMEGAGLGGAVGLTGRIGRRARRRTKTEAAKQGIAKGGGGLQIGGTGWVAGPNGYAIRLPVGQEAAHELAQNLGVRRVQLQTRALLPPRCLPRFRQRKQGQAMSLRVRDGTELNAVLLPKRKSAGQESVQGEGGAQGGDSGADSNLTQGQKQQRYRRRQHELWRKGFRVVRAQRWGGGTR